MKEFPFRVPICTYEIEDWEEKKKSIQLPDLADKHLDQGVEVYTDFFEWDHAGVLPPYADQVFKAAAIPINKFKKSGCLGRNHQMEISSMWFESQLDSHKHRVHNHGMYGWSCILYYDFHENIHMPTTFYSPFHDFKDGNLMSYVPRVKEGSIVFFPAALHHESIPNRSPVKRTIISFNVKGHVDKTKAII